MVTGVQAQTNYVAGQISPHLLGRYDFPLYRAGLQKALNVICRPQGGFFRRPGYKEVYDGDPSGRMINFNLTTTQSCKLLFEPDGNLRVVDDTETLVATLDHKMDGAIELQAMRGVQIRDVFVYVSGRTLFPQVLRAGTSIFYDGTGAQTKFIISFPYFASTEIVVKVNGVTKTLTTDYTITDSPNVNGQIPSGLITFTSAPANGADIEIIRKWSIVDYPSLDGPWEPENLDKNRKVKVAYATSGTVYDSTDETFTGLVDVEAQTKKGGVGAWFDDAWVGRKLRIFQKNGDEENWGVVEIDTVDTTHSIFNCTVDDNFPLIFADDGSGPTPKIDYRTRRWRLSAWYEDHYPEAVAVFDNRLFFFRGPDRWSTVAGDLFTLSPDTISGLEDEEIYLPTDESGISYSSTDPASTKVQWAIGHKVLHVGTDTAHAIIGAGSSTGALASSTISEEKQTGVGCAAIDPIILNALYYVDISRQSLYRSEFKFQQSSFVSEKVNNYDDEILYPRVKQMALITQPFSMIWCVLDNGQIAVCTNNEVDNLYAWTLLEFPEQIWDVVVNKDSNGRERVYLYAGVSGKIYKMGQFRTNGTETYSKINYRNDNYLSTDFYHTYSNLQDEEIITDAATIYSAGSIDLSTIPEGKVLVEKKTYKNYVRETASRTVTLSNDYEIGTPFYPEAITNKLSLTYQEQSNIANKRKVQKIGFNVWRTMSFKCRVINGTAESSFNKNIDFRRTGTSLSAPPSLFTGLHWESDISGSKDEEYQLKISQVLQQPLNLNSIVYKYDIDGQE